MEIIEKSGAWYSYAGTRLGQGRENVKEFLRDNKNITAEVEAKIRAQLIVTTPVVVEEKANDAETTED
jgi:recombination protein RecA